MKINLKSLPVYVISFDDNPKIVSHLKENGYSNINVIPAVRRNTKALGCVHAHYNVIKQIESLPCIVLEDDARIFRDVDYLNIPENTDMMYLGISAENGFGDVVCNKIDKENNIYTIGEPLGTFALLYVSRKYVDIAKSATFRSASGIWPIQHADYALNAANDLYQGLNIYATDPIFYHHDENSPYLSNRSRMKSLDVPVYDCIF